MSFVAVAVAGANIAGAVIGSKSAKKARKAETAAAEQNIALQREQNVEARRQYDQNRTDLAPARNIGTVTWLRVLNAAII